ncbi:MAG: transcriptional regulator [Candidatus Hermodarchaeota archaeon]|nr:transcriptional regulator [Candidatus Hermodarchaeota archaeon]
MSEKLDPTTSIPIVDDIDRIIHEPARLIIMSYLFVLERVDFLFLKRHTKLSWGNLSSHVTKLETAGYVEVIKKFMDRKPYTLIQLTKAGRKTFEEYQNQMRSMFGSLDS